MSSASDSEGEEEVPSWKGVSGTVILVNLYDPLHLGTAITSYKATCDLVKSYLRETSAELLGVCLYGTDYTSASLLGMEGVIQVFPLTAPTLDDYKKLQNVNIASSGQAKDLKLSDALWHTSKMFANCKKLLATKTVILLTRMDLPPVQPDQKPALKRVVDLADSGIHVKIINVSENNYIADKFYKNFVTEAHKGVEYEMPVHVWDHADIAKLMYHDSHRHIAVARLSFQIGEEFSIGVGVFGLLKSTSSVEPKKVLAHKETNQIVTSTITNYKVTTATDAEVVEGMDLDGEPAPQTKEVPLLKSELLYYQVFGEEKIQFTVDEMKTLKNPFGLPMMKLLGFKPASILCKEKWFLKSCQFLFPSESLIEGSTIPFKALHQACTEQSVIAICVLCTRVNSRPFIVALSPCSRPLGLHVKIGFDLIYIPFVENIRNVPNKVCEDEVQEAHKIVFKDIIKNLTFDFKSDTFENPALQSLYCAIEALALGKDEIEHIVDTTKPDKNKLKNINAELFEELFGPFGVAAVKRPLATRDNNAGGKRGRSYENVDEHLLQTRLDDRLIHKYTVTDLKKILNNCPNADNIPALTGLKKDELVQMVYMHCAS